MIIFATKI